MRRQTIWITLAVASIGMTGCKKDEPKPTPPAEKAPPAPEAKKPPPAPEAAKPPPPPEKPKELLPGLEGVKFDPQEIAYKKGDMVWAAAVGSKGTWGYTRYRYDSHENNIVKVKSLGALHAPAPFVHALDTSKLKKGQAVMVGKGLVGMYGRVVKTKGDKVQVAYSTGGKMANEEVDRAAVEAIEPKKFVTGAPIAYQEGDLWLAGMVAAEANDKVFFLGNKNKIMQKPAAELKLIDVSKKWKKGAKVMARSPSGFSPLKFKPGKITKVIEKGTEYEVKTDEGKIFKASYSKIMPAK